MEFDGFVLYIYIYVCVEDGGVGVVPARSVSRPPALGAYGRE